LVRLERQNDGLCLEVEDDGEARPAGTVPGRSGLGLRSMAQRAAALRGTLATGPLPERGYRVRLVVPL
jgi:signal transduction histidine kinase